MGANSSKDENKIPNVVIAGLNGSGKTSLLYTYTKNKDNHGNDQIFPPQGKVKPTLGINREQISQDSDQMQYEGKPKIYNVWELGGHPDIRQSLWSNFFSAVQPSILVYVIKSKDPLHRLRMSKNILHQLYKAHPNLKDSALFIIYNTFHDKDQQQDTDQLAFEDLQELINKNKLPVPNEKIIQKEINMKDKGHLAETQKVFRAIGDYLREEEIKQKKQERKEEKEMALKRQDEGDN